MSRRRDKIKDHFERLLETINPSDILYKVVLASTCIVTLIEIADSSNGLALLIAMLVGICVGMMVKGEQHGKRGKKG